MRFNAASCWGSVSRCSEEHILFFYTVSSGPAHFCLPGSGVNQKLEGGDISWCPDLGHQLSSDTNSPFFCVQIFGMAFSMILYCQIGRKESATRPANA